MSAVVWRMRCCLCAVQQRGDVLSSSAEGSFCLLPGADADQFHGSSHSSVCIVHCQLPRARTAQEFKLWLSRIPNTEPIMKTDRFERGSYMVFDTATWDCMRKVQGLS